MALGCWNFSSNIIGEKMKHKKSILVIALIALMACVAMPVQAYTELSSHTWTYSSGYAAWNTQIFTVHNLSAFSRDVTHIESSVTGMWQNTSMAHTGTETYTVNCDGGGDDGNISISWDLAGDHISWVPDGVYPRSIRLRGQKCNNRGNLLF